MTFYYNAPQTMDISKEGLCFLAAREGIAFTKYLDIATPPVQTIGLGATSSDIKDLKSWPWDKKLSIQECFDLYKLHLQKYINAVKKALKVEVTQNEFDALVSICYNIGTSGMANSTFMKRINAKASKESIRQAILMWNKPAKLVKTRRIPETKVFMNADYGDVAVAICKVSPKSHKVVGYSGTINPMDYI